MTALARKGATDEGPPPGEGLSPAARWDGAGEGRAVPPGGRGPGQPGNGFRFTKSSAISSMVTKRTPGWFIM